MINGSELDPQMPWYGYSLGEWNERLEREAQLAVEGRYLETGEKFANERVDADDVVPNASKFTAEDYED